MTNEQKQVKDWMTAFGQETPEKPIIPSLEIRKLRAKLHLEECLESIRALGLAVTAIKGPENLVECEFLFVEANKYEPNLELIADGCEDLKVVTEGTLVACGLIKESKFEKNSTGGFRCIEYHYDIDPLFDEVMRSNWTKLWTGNEIESEPLQMHQYSCKQVPSFDSSRKKYLVKDKDGKVIKSPSYKPANLQPIINELSK